MNSLAAYDSGSSSGDSSDEEEVKTTNVDSTLHLKAPPVSAKSLSSSMVKIAMSKMPHQRIHIT